MRLIDATALKKQCIETDKWGKIILILDIVNAPTIDAEQVVHCKDCEHWHNGVNITYCYRLGVAMIKENDYCSFGERREP